MRFKINLATKIYIDTRLLKFSTVVTVLLLVVLLFINIKSSAEKTAEMQRLSRESAVSDDKSKTVGKGVSEKEYLALLNRISFANSVIEKKAYNWLALLDSLEQVVPDGVAISSIEPDSKNQGLKLSGIALNFNNLRMFMEHLEASKFFSDVYLESQGDVKLGDPKLSTVQGITFSLTCRVIKK
ncbi:MAG TPA: PilN domain-containing protein [Geobacteraceae bacterium]